MLSLRGFQSSMTWIAWVDVSCLNGVFCSWVYCREGMRSIVSPLECTPTPHPSCEPVLVQLKPVPSVLCGTAFPVGLQSWLSFWRVFQSRSYEIPGPESIPAIFQAERGQQLIYIHHLTTKAASDVKADGTQYTSNYLSIPADPHLR